MPSTTAEKPAIRGFQIFAQASKQSKRLIVDPAAARQALPAKTTRADDRALRYRRHQNSGCFIAEIKTLPISDENGGNVAQIVLVSNPISSFSGQIKTPF